MLSFKDFLKESQDELNAWQDFAEQVCAKSQLTPSSIIVLAPGKIKIEFEHEINVHQITILFRMLEDGYLRNGISAPNKWVNKSLDTDEDAENATLIATYGPNN